MDRIKSGSTVVPNIRTFARDASRAQEKTDASAARAQKKAAQEIPVTQAPIAPPPPTSPTIAIPQKQRAAAPPKKILKDVYKEVSEAAAQNPERGSSSGVIVRDTLKDRWTLGKALKAEFTKWVDEQNADSRGPNVAPAASRTPIIKKAGAGSAIAPQDDYAHVLATLRERHKDGSGVISAGLEDASHTPHVTDVPDVPEVETPPVKSALEDAAEAPGKGAQAHWAHTLEDAMHPESERREETQASTAAIKNARPRLGAEQEETVREPNSVGVSPSLEDLVAPTVTSHTKEAVLSPQLKRQAEEHEAAQEKERQRKELEKQRLEAEARAQEEERRAEEERLREAARIKEEAEKKWKKAAKREAREETTLHERTLRERREAEEAVVAGAQQEPAYREAVGEDETFMPTETEREQEALAEEPLMPMPSREREARAPQSRGTSVVRTYRDDAIGNVRDRNLSKLKIATAEAQEREDRLRGARAIPSSIQSGRETPILLILILIFAILSAGFAGYLWFVRGSDTVAPITLTRVPTFIAGVTQESIPFSDDRAELMSTLSEAASANRAPNSIVQLYPARTVGAGGSEEVVPVSDFMSVFDPRTNGSFARSLKSDMMFGVHTAERTSPYFIFRAEQFDVAFAGMLAWEENMSADLSPLFGAPVRRSFDPTSFTADSTSAAGFTDEVLRNTNVRILYDELGDVRIVYAFVDKQTIVITSSVEAMIALIEALRS